MDLNSFTFIYTVNLVKYLSKIEKIIVCELRSSCLGCSVLLHGLIFFSTRGKSDVIRTLQSACYCSENSIVGRFIFSPLWSRVQTASFITNIYTIAHRLVYYLIIFQHIRKIYKVLPTETFFGAQFFLFPTLYPSKC